MLFFFRIISTMEGLSLISLLFVALPLRYQFGMDFIVPFVGMLHGILFMVYFFMSLIVSHLRKWSVGFWATVLFSSVIPTAFYFLDKKLKAQDNA